MQVQYNLVKPPPSVHPEFGDKLSKDRKPDVNSLIMTDSLILTSLPEMSIITYNFNIYSNK